MRCETQAKNRTGCTLHIHVSILEIPNFWMQYDQTLILPSTCNRQQPHQPKIMRSLLSCMRLLFSTHATPNPCYSATVLLVCKYHWHNCSPMSMRRETNLPTSFPRPYSVTCCNSHLRWVKQHILWTLYSTGLGSLGALLGWLSSDQSCFFESLAEEDRCM